MKSSFLDQSAIRKSKMLKNVSIARIVFILFELEQEICEFLVNTFNETKLCRISLMEVKARPHIPHLSRSMLNDFLAR